MATRMKKLPGVLSFQRCMFPTDALFYNLYSGKDKTALPVIRHGIRGTQNINKTWSEKATEATVASAKRDEVSNIQTTDSAKLDVSANALSVQFDLRFIDLSDALFACAAGKGDSMDDIKTFRDNVAQFIDKAKNGKGIVEVACRYARNIANGRFLWRNRTIAESIQIRVDDSDEKSASGFSVTFNALDVPLNTFDNISEDEKKLADVIVKGLKGDRQARLRISARVDFGMQGPLEVFPSQNYLEKQIQGICPAPCISLAVSRQNRKPIPSNTSVRPPSAIRKSAMPCAPSIPGIPALKTVTSPFRSNRTVPASMHSNSSGQTTSHPVSA